VTIERENCIACCNCHTNCPDVFELNPDDGLSQIKVPYRHDDASLGEGSVPDNLGGCVRMAEDICPVSIIHVTKQ
jgi:ferredoxin